MNTWIGIGNLGRDPEVKFTPSGQAVANFSIALNERWKDKDGAAQERTEWVRIVVWGKQAETCGQYLSKGRQVAVIGRLQTRDYEKDGQKHYITEIVASHVEFIGSKPQEGTQREAPGQGIGGVPMQEKAPF
jgi:single-strand DNA-binding protein